MTPRESNSIAQAINAMNAKRSARAEAAAGFIVALVLGVLGALALLHFATPCEAGALCMGGAVLVPTRRDTWLQRLCRPLRRVYLRRLIAAAEFDADWHAETLATAPLLRDLAERRAAELRAQLELL